MAEAALRLGFVWPGGGAEQEYYRFAETLDDRIKIFLAPTRVGGDTNHDHDLEALLQTARIDWITEAARRLKILKPDSVFWACTSGSFVVGRAGAEAQAAALEDALGVPAGSTSLAFVSALERLGLRRVSVLATYPEPASRAFVAFLNEFDIEVPHLQWMDAPSGWDASLIEDEVVVSNARAATIPGVEALLVPDTAYPSLHLVERLEQVTGLTVLTANAVTLWRAIELAGGVLPVEGHGRLLADPPERAA